MAQVLLSGSRATRSCSEQRVTDQLLCESQPSTWDDHRRGGGFSKPHCSRPPPGIPDTVSDGENCCWLRGQVKWGPEQVALPFSHGERARHLAPRSGAAPRAACPSSSPSTPWGSRPCLPATPLRRGVLHVKNSFNLHKGNTPFSEIH